MVATRIWTLVPHTRAHCLSHCANCPGLLACFTTGLFNEIWKNLKKLTFSDMLTFCIQPLIAASCCESLALSSYHVPFSSSLVLHTCWVTGKLQIWKWQDKCRWLSTDLSDWIHHFFLFIRLSVHPATQGNGKHGCQCIIRFKGPTAWEVQSLSPRLKHWQEALEDIWGTASFSQNSTDEWREEATQALSRLLVCPDKVGM